MNSSTRAEVRRVLVGVGTGGTTVDTAEARLVALVDDEVGQHRRSVLTRSARLLRESGHGEAADELLADEL